MIVRIVQMTFRQEEVNTFTTLFNERKELIRHFAGCTHLELWQDKNTPNVFFTYSHWESETALDHYRFSGPIQRHLDKDQGPLRRQAKSVERELCSDRRLTMPGAQYLLLHLYKSSSIRLQFRAGKIKIVSRVNRQQVHMRMWHL